ncbi:5740_t:CDS:2 [Dentiscutata erythropus]|uniref:5740_t:CDS:1 n=1 Tax=Dentiscutata erythropus TaxID=1348616 RepID=A0A9N8ZPK7_9GLOM|nr:5740_t:CDS:2 [Dentiscutata erythropus]
MKFGSQLRAALYDEWAENYVDYDGLKKLLKRGINKEGGYGGKDETEFTGKLDKELEKVYAFQNAKYEEIKNKVQRCEDTVNLISKDSSSNAKERYMEVERQINDITEELNELAKYKRLNYTGIMKIIKKHNRRTKFDLTPLFSVRLESCPFYKETFEPIVINLSQLYHTVHQGLGSDQSSTPLNLSSINATALPSRERHLHQSRKYWIHPDNVMEVKTTILRHLPVLIYKPGSDPSITSLYFDNEAFELYQDKVDRKPGDQIIRLRWYGKKESTHEIFVERKVREQGEEEVKDRFLIKEKYVDEFLKGTYSMDKTIKKMKENPGKTEEDIKNFQTLVKDIQDTINDKNLQPVLRTYYNRMAFQIPRDDRVRISLDTEFYIIREDNFDVKRRLLDSWRRLDIDDANFGKLSPSECTKFPYAILEIKLNLDGEQEPNWVKELVKNGLIEEAPQFSKYVHGVATLFTSQAPSLPYWLPNIDKDILKPSVRQTSEGLDEDYEEGSSSALYGISQENSNRPGKNIIDIDSGDRRDKGKAVEPIGLKTFRKIFRRRIRSRPDRSIIPFNVKEPEKIVGVVKVEAKVFFANERTFFSWMRFSILLSTFALALFNAAAADNDLGMRCAMAYTAIGITTLVYSLYSYNRRLSMINAKNPGPYDDVVAPIFVCSSLIIASGLNFYLKLHPTLIEGSHNDSTINIK